MSEPRAEISLFGCQQIALQILVERITQREIRAHVSRMVVRVLVASTHALSEPIATQRELRDVRAIRAQDFEHVLPRPIAYATASHRQSTSRIGARGTGLTVSDTDASRVVSDVIVLLTTFDNADSTP